MPVEQLSHRTVLLVGGPDAEHLLEGLVTSSLPETGEVRASALLTPQGKILFTFLLSRKEDGFRLECDAGERDALHKRLLLYRLRAKVEFALGDEAVFATTQASAATLIDSRHPRLGARLYGAAQARTDDAAPDYTARRVAAGVLEGPDEIEAGGDFPHDVALDCIGAVSFTKGCFVGQEVVSRVKHRGTARRRPVLVRASELAPGAAVMRGDREVGRVRAVAPGAREGVAIVRLDHLGAGSGLSLNGHPVEVALPDYASYSLEAA